MSTPQQGRLAWRTSSFTNTEECVELAWPNGSGAVRDSKDTGRSLSFARARLAAFVADTKAGTFDRLVTVR